MRIDPNLVPTILAGLQQSQVSLNTALQEVSTGKSVNEPSDNPAASADMVQNTIETADVDQYTQNVNSVLSTVQTASSVLSSVVSSLTQAVSLGTEGANGTNSTSNLQAIAAASEQFGSAPLVAVFDFGYREIERQISQRGALVNKPAVERSLQLGISEEVTKLEMNMPWLATVASVSPFIGLFGTVWGIIDAFEGLGTAGSASLRAVAPGISEALVTTAIGLAAAIPAAIFYNIFGSRIKDFGTRMEDFAIEFQNFADRDFGG